MMEAQYLSMIALGFGSFIFGMMPLKLSTRAKRSHPFFLSLLLCLGGGVLLATSLVHMLAEVSEKLQNFAELYFCAGFFLLYTIDEITHYCLGDPLSESKEEIPTRKSSSISSHDELLPRSKMRSRANTNYGTLLTLPPKNALDRRRSYSGDSMSYTKEYIRGLQSSDYYKFKSEGIDTFNSNHSCCSKHNFKNSYPSSRISQSVETVHKPSTSGLQNAHHNDNNHEHKHEHEHDHDHQHQSNSASCHVDVGGEPCVENRAGVIGLLIALLIHSILEGTSIGVQTNSSEILLVLGAVSCHKLVLSFCLGIELSSSGYQSFSFVTAITVFSIGSPIGIAIGMSLTSPTSGVLTLEAPLQALAAGSLLYVAAFEVLPRERFKYQHNNNHKSAGILQLVSVALGFATITLLNIFVVSEHDYLDDKISKNTTGV